MVSAFAWRLLLHASAERFDQRLATNARTSRSRPTESFYPLTLPLTVGPGSISVAITLGSQRPTEALTMPGTGDARRLPRPLASWPSPLTIYLCYRFAEKTAATIGESATNVIVRLTAFILLCIGIQIIWKGYSGLTQIAT